jgi:hypothetical protein
VREIAFCAAVAATSIALASCETAAERIGSKEDLLAAAGFTVRPANTPQREAELKQLPPNKFVLKTKGDRVSYAYADPVVCDCLYIGDQHAYGAFKQELFTRRLADEEQMTAITYQDSWDWGEAGWNDWDWDWDRGVGRSRGRR